MFVIFVNSSEAFKSQTRHIYSFVDNCTASESPIKRALSDCKKSRTQTFQNSSSTPSTERAKCSNCFHDRLGRTREIKSCPPSDKVRIRIVSVPSLPYPMADMPPSPPGPSICRASQVHSLIILVVAVERVTLIWFNVRKQ